MRLESRPDVINVLVKDALRVYYLHNEIDIYAYRTDDYLDDIRKLTAEESISLDVRMAHDLMTKWVHYIKPPPAPPKRKKKSRKYKQNKAHTSMISIAEISIGKD